MTQTELADALGINQSQVSRYVRRGMPLDVRGAKAWMSNNIRLTMRAPLYRRQTTVKRAALAPRELMELAADIIDLLADCEGEDFAQGCEHLRSVIVALPDEMGAALSLPPKVWAGLMRLAEGAPP